MVLSHDSQTEVPAAQDGWPATVDLILSALEAGRDCPLDRRRNERNAYRVRASLRLFSDAAGTPPWTLYTRDVTPRALGFITLHCLPLGHGGTVRLPGPDGQDLQIPCTLLRCRRAAPGWYEGAVYFNREQFVFAPA